MTRSPFSSRRPPDAPRSRAVPPVLGMALTRSGFGASNVPLRADFQSFDDGLERVVGGALFGRFLPRLAGALAPASFQPSRDLTRKPADPQPTHLVSTSVLINRQDGERHCIPADWTFHP